MYKMMTPGPVQVPEKVRFARSMETGNADLDLKFVEDYKNLCQRISSLLHTNNETLILSGEGILGLEAAIASITEPGDEALVLDNGIYGAGFADFVTMYGGNATLYTTDYKNEINVDALKSYLEKNHNFKYATVVHCDTPSGMLNNVEEISRILKSYGILTVVDSVSGMFGNELNIDAGKIDIVCGGSQKAVSAPPGLTFVTISDDAKKAMHNRNTPIASFYCNLTIFDSYYESKWFPYTMPISDIYGLDAAISLIEEDTELISRTHSIAVAVRKAIEQSGLSNHLQSGFSDTVTVFDVPSELNVDALLERMLTKHNILLSESFGDLKGKVVRIGHMGANANIADVGDTLAALDETFDYYHYKLKKPLYETYQEELLD